MNLRVGSKVEFNVGSGGTIWTGIVESIHDNHEYVEVNASGLTMALPKSILRIVDEDQSPCDDGDYDHYINERERQHEATLDAIEAERDLKAYRAEHGDDAPDPTPTNEFKFVLYGNEGEQDLYTIESVWHEHPAGAMYLIERRDGDGILYTHYVLGHHLQRSENDPRIAIFIPALRAAHDLESDTLQPQIATLQCEVDGLNYQLQTARRAQDQLRDELAAVTAERDALKKRVEVQSGTIYKLGKSWDFDREKLKDAEQRAALGDPAQFEAQALKSEIFGLEFMVERFKAALEKINELALQIVQSAPTHEFTPIVAQFGLTAHEALAPIPDDDTE